MSNLTQNDEASFMKKCRQDSYLSQTHQTKARKSVVFAEMRQMCSIDGEANTTSSMSPWLETGAGP